MAFRMNRPIIKGTANHKASIAKAKAKSVVSQSRTKADAGLIAASNALGKSYKPSEIDFELDKINIDVPEKKAKKTLTPEEQAAKDAKRAERKAKRKNIGKNILDVGGKIVDGVKTAVGGALLVPVAIGGGLFKLGKNIVDEFGNIVEGAKDKYADNYVGKGEIDDPETNYKNTQEYKDDLKKKQEAENEAKFRADQAANKPITLPPRSVRSLPSNKQKDKLMESTATANTIKSSKSTDRQMEKANEYMTQEYGENFDLNDPDIRKEYIDLLENPEREGVQLSYDDKKDEWVLGGGYLSPEDIKTQKNMQAAASQYGLQPTDMQMGEDGKYTPKEGAVSPQYGDTWGDMGDGTMGWLDDGREQYYSQSGKKISKEKSEELAIKQEEKGRKALRQQNIDEAREYYGDVVTTKERFAEYMRLKNEGTLAESYKAQQEQEQDIVIDIEEEDDIDFTDPEYVEETTSEPVVEETTTEPVVEQVTTTPDRKPRPSDFEGTWKEKQEQYKIANEKWYQAQQAKKGKSAMTMRDNRIYRNAVKGGTVQQNMIKSGYIPE